jgi:ABC-type multidrug transport system ATPase subunit
MLSADRSVCRCGFDIAWITNGRPHFHRAMSQPRPVQLQLEVRWADGVAAVSGAPDQPLKLPLVGETLWAEPRDNGRFLVRLGSASRETATPAKFTASGATISLWLQAIYSNASDARRYAANPATILAPRSLASAPEWTIGRSADNDMQLADDRVALRHAVIARQGEDGPYWLADHMTREGTYVNRKRILACELKGGDLVQIGPFAWIFSHDGYLVPAPLLRGAEITATNLIREGRLHIPHLQVLPGQFVAIVGESGAGKSTLLKALARLPGYVFGSLAIDGHDADAHPQRYRSALAYLSQDAFVHPELTPLQSLRCIAESRIGRTVSAEAEGLLRSLEVPQERWNAKLEHLSGGEQQRVRIACELLSRPRFALLDEPARGLDREREIALMRLLRGLADRGCTVVLITHSLDQAALCDRMLYIERGKIRYDGKPVSDIGDVKSTDAELAKQAEPSPSPTTHAVDVGSHRAGALDQTRVMIRRELMLLRNAWPLRLALPLVGIPAVFALMLHLAMRGSDNPPLLGFFAILSAVWMGASLSLMSIVGEREVFDHEQFLYLRIGSYLVGKWMLLACMATLQLWIFWTLLVLLRFFGGQPELRDYFFAGLALWLVHLAAVAHGLFLSALAGRSKATANFLLPLLMIVQILFSVVVRDPQRLRDSLHLAYPSEANDASLGSRISLATLSRHGDMLLRSFAYDDPSPFAESFAYASRRAVAVEWLVGIGIAMFLASAICLWAQSRLRTRG